MVSQILNQALPNPFHPAEKSGPVRRGLSSQGTEQSADRCTDPIHGIPGGNEVRPGTVNESPKSPGMPRLAPISTYVGWTGM